MKICHVTTVHDWRDVRIFEKECISLAAAGHEVTLIAPCEGSLIERGIRVVGIGDKRGMSRWKRATRLVNKALREAVNMKADVYHVHDPELLRITAKLKRKSGARVIYDSHEDLPRQVLGKHYIPANLRPVIASLVEKLENSAVGKLDGVIAATPHIAERFRAVATAVETVQNFPMLREFLSLTPRFDTVEKPQLCYAGGLTEIRGTREMLRILDDVDDIQLCIAGTASDQYSKDALRQYEAHPNLRLLGSINRKGIQDLYQESYLGLALLHPNENYLLSYPIKLFEYMASSIPVIASDFPLWKTIVDEAQCGFCVNPFNLSEVIRVVRHLVANPELAKTMGENGRRAVVEKYNWEIEEKKLIRFYKNLE